jgi:hypothetical protein
MTFKFLEKDGVFSTKREARCRNIQFKAYDQDAQYD